MSGRNKNFCLEIFGRKYLLPVVAAGYDKPCSQDDDKKGFPHKYWQKYKKLKQQGMCSAIKMRNSFQKKNLILFLWQGRKSISAGISP
jgi:hypothetical protein